MAVPGSAMVTFDEWARVKAVVGAALARPQAERANYLARHCDDEAMHREAASLLASALAAAELYDAPTLLVGGEPAALDVFEHLASTPYSTLHRAAALARDNAAVTNFAGTDRYGLRRRIGAGGMGIVYEVEDRERRQIVALKTLRRWNADDIYRLKQEFRALAGIAHTNLALLHDLVVDDGQCFFTMELVDGGTFVDYVRASGTADADRARAAMTQLVDGLDALHSRGRLHRDVKPSNVLVARDGRVVILDFGLAGEVVRDREAAEAGLIGTPAYLAPEQCRGIEATVASDWYAAGATLYHALTGRPPFDGPVDEVIARKISEDPVPAQAIDPRVPDDLNDVCQALLSRDPEVRLTGREAAARVTSGARQPIISPIEISGQSFVGRERELGILRTAFADVRAGRGVTVCIHGPSGIGKSALVQEFVDRSARDVPVLSLRSRCHERESLPYKGIDGVVDGLSRYVATLPRGEAAALMPPDAAAIASLFPVMQIEAVAGTDHDHAAADPVARRQHAFAALRELLRRVAARHPLIVEIDDFQWADADSAASLSELLRPPDPPPLLLLVSFRTEEIDSKPFLRALVERIDSSAGIPLPLAPLTGDEVAQLVESLLPGDSGPGIDARIGIAQEARGNPYLAEELARDATLGAHRGATLHEMLVRRLEALPPDARGFVEMLSVCGRPIHAARIFDACGLTGDERPLVARLRSAHLLRNSRSPDHVEMYHDRVRETLAAALPPDRVRHIHAVMARTLVAHGDDDPEALFDHYRGAGEIERAAQQAAAAAERASRVLAFDRAAAYFRHALDLQPDSGDRATWKAGLARCLENAGRPIDAAEACFDAAREAIGLDRIEWQRKAGEQLLIGGHVDRGLATIEALLPAVGISLPTGPRAAVAAMLWRRGALAWRGLDFRPRAAADVAPNDLLRIDTCWAISTGLMLVDTLRASAFHAGHLRAALDVGEPYRVARALALEAVFAAARGGRTDFKRSRTFVAHARAAADRVRHPHVVALSSLTAGIASFVVGDWRPATDLSEQALTMLREQCSGVVWELTLAQIFFLGSLLYRGQMRRVNHRLPDLLEAARDRGNLYFEEEISVRMGLTWLAMDDPDACEHQAGQAMVRWSASGFHRQHYNYLIARLQVALYRGRAQEAWTLLTDTLPDLHRSLWLHVHFMRVEFAFIRARCALAMAAEGRDARRMRATAARDAATLERVPTLWTTPLALLVRAALAFADERRADATSHLASAVEAFDRADMRLYAAAGRRRLAGLVEGERGAELRRVSDAYMAAEDIRNPEALTRLLIPAFNNTRAS